MGDGGALLLGLLMAAATVSVGGRTEAAYSGQSFFFFAPVFIPVVILGVPLFDMAFAVFRRVATPGLRVTDADKEHLHHRLLRLGHGHRRAVLILWGWTALLSGFVLWPTYSGDGDAIVPIGVLALGLLLFTVLHPRLRASPTGVTDSGVVGGGVGD
jgi:UDP-GlcNAc:undecaprenyl-phosphate GlcNAc-1-phosphate transferase